VVGEDTGHGCNGLKSVVTKCSEPTALGLTSITAETPETNWPVRTPTIEPGLNISSFATYIFFLIPLPVFTLI